ncbi:MBL fold metallo-hydrolase [Bacillus sp. ISL-7]|uniref:MBL fold metallo-hydrolase n=1 Tax=Bacillus sp. ISL-7 TaxID=2819136 RepID=UPI0027E073AB|nr:MBL fold metallo-hydrolase [Bacillus sp. ISL-7]
MEEIMKIADGIEMLELEMNMMGNRRTIHPTLLHDGNHAVLVDTGMPGQLEDIKAAMKKAGVPFEQLDAVILTHQDIDHIGSIQEVLKAARKPIDVYAHAEDKPFIEGDKEPIKMTRDKVTQMLSRIPEDMRKQVETIFLNPPTAKITKVVSDGDVLPFFGGVEVIFTPGHSPGHFSLYHHPTKTLITGDATVSEDGKILGPNPQATPDMPMALESQKKFTLFDIAKVICYHGGLVDNQVNEQFRKLSEVN